MKLNCGSYDNSITVKDESEILAEFHLHSKLAYQRNNLVRHIPYDDDSRAEIDWFISRQSSHGTIIFIHGGYWQSCNKEDFASLPLNH